MKMLGKIEILSSSCNISTIRDGRGGIFTWVPEDPLLEFNMLYFLPGKVRGNHYHPHFNEYFLIVEGSGVVITIDPETKKELNMHVSKGSCLRIPKGVSHAFHAITSATCISMLSKPWEECDPPIVHEELIPFGEEYEKYAKKTGFKNSIEELKDRKKTN
jgi:mannose-6-phosphate isomerase-like protein (cupin superfamily)